MKNAKEKQYRKIFVVVYLNLLNFHSLAKERKSSDTIMCAMRMEKLLANTIHVCNQQK